LLNLFQLSTINKIDKLTAVSIPASQSVICWPFRNVFSAIDSDQKMKVKCLPQLAKGSIINGVERAGIRL